MNFELKKEIRKVLCDINFIERYEHMSDDSRKQVSRSDSKEVEVEQVIDIINSIGYEVVFDKKEKFFKVGLVENVPKYRIWFNIVLRSGVAEFIWVVYHNNEVRLGSPWSIYVKLLSPDKRIKPPLYSDEQDLKKLLKQAMNMYDDFKSALIAEYQANLQ